MDKVSIFSKKLGELEVFLRKKSQLDQDVSGALDILRAALKQVPLAKEEDKMEKASNLENLSLEGKLRQLNCEYYLFSDGACRGNPGPGSYFVFIQDLSEKIIDSSSGFDAKTTNNRMELQGVIDGLKLIIQQKGETHSTSKIESKILVCTDSKYVLDGLKSWRFNWKARGWKKADKKDVLNKEQWIELDRLVERFSSVEYFWVKGHSQFPQNEYCDQQCNQILDQELEV